MALQLGDSTNRWGTAPTASAVMAARASGVNEYPSAFGDALKDAVARYIGVEASQVVTGCGSDNVLDVAIRAFSEPGDGIAWCAPTFALMPLLARLQRLQMHEAGFTRDGNIDVDGLLATGARIIYVCSPNNPTGQVAAPESIERLALEAPGLVIVDEAYAEFSGTSAASRATSWDRVLVTRTLSKAFGLAGLRAGYGISHDAVIRRMERARGPYTLNIVAEHAAAAALDRDREWMRIHAAEAVENRDRLAERLRTLGFLPMPSAANFLCVPVADADAVAAALNGEGIVVRAFSRLPGIGDAIRVSSAPWEQLARFIDAFTRITSGGGT